MDLLRFFFFSLRQFPILLWLMGPDEDVRPSPTLERNEMVELS